jgi:hypothetical protein
MKVNPSRRSILTILCVIGSVAFISLAVWNYAQQEAEPSGEFAANGEPAADPALEPDVSAETPEVTAEDAERMAPARRIVHVPDTRGEIVVTRALEQSEYMGDKAAAFLTEAIDRALVGDVVMAGYIRDFNYLCEVRVPPDAEALERMVESAMSMVNRNATSESPIPAAGRPWLLGLAVSNGLAIRVYPLEHQMRAHLLDWQRGCKDAAAILNDALRSELELLARDGHVMARYLYAMWRPNPALSEEALERALHWQMNAAEFSYANVAEGEPIGLLAFGQSYAEGLFTPTDQRLAHLMLNAAYQCGYGEGLEIMDWIKPFFDESERMRLWLENIVQLPRQRFDELTAQLTASCR